MSEHPDPVEELQRWEAGGANWRVLSRVGGVLRIELVTCTGDEVVDVLTSSDRALLQFVGDRTSNED